MSGPEEDIANQMITNAQGPAEAQSDQGRVRQHSIPDLIAAETHLARKRAMKSPKAGIKYVRLVPPGTEG